MSYWVLRVNQTEFRILDWLRAFPWMADDRLIDVWQVPAESKIQPGDGIFVWIDEAGAASRDVSGSRRDSAIPEIEMETAPTGAGIYASGKVAPPQQAFPPDRKKTYFASGMSEPSGQTISVKYMRLFLGAPMLESDFKANPLLANMPELARSGDRVYELTDQQGAAIEKLIGGRTSMPDNPECHT